MVAGESVSLSLRVSASGADRLASLDIALRDVAQNLARPIIQLRDRSRLPRPPAGVSARPPSLNTGMEQKRWIAMATGIAR